MNVQDSVHQAITVGAITPSTIRQIKQAAGRNDARTQKILEDTAN